MKRKCITIAIGNQKGGVGKTSSTACIGAALAPARKTRIVG